MIFEGMMWQFFFFFVNAQKNHIKNKFCMLLSLGCFFFYIPKTKTKKQRLSQSVFESVVAVIFKVFLT
jgi:hypothetical protein